MEHRVKSAGRGNSAAPGKESLLEGCSSIFSVLAVGLFALTFLFENFVIPSSSMASTLLVGDHVLAERETLAPPTKWAPFLPYREVHRNDIIVFYNPVEDATGEHIFLVKRVIGVPGDHIHLRFGTVYLNGIAQKEAHVIPTSASVYDSYVDDFPSIDPRGRPGVTAEWSVTLPTLVQGGDLVVPPGKYFVMGDNRDNSLDSRFWGFVPREHIIGRPLLVYWSIQMPESNTEDGRLSRQVSSMLSAALHFADRTRWRRTFHPID